MRYTNGITRACCNNVLSLSDTGTPVTVCNLYAYFDIDLVLGYNLTEFGIVLTPPINLTDLTNASAELKIYLEANGYVVGSVTMEDVDGGLFITVNGTNLPDGAAQVELILGAGIVNEDILSSCGDNWEAREDNDFELREGGGFELRE